MASKWYNPFSWGAKEPSIMTKTVTDPLKQAVATPYSKFLSERIGKGLPRYEGELSPSMSPDMQSRYSEFMNIDAGQWFDKAVGDPETRRFKEDLLPEVQEGYAGALRGSGRFRDVEDYTNRFSQDLAAQRTSASLDINKAQLDTGFQEWAVRQEQAQLEYADWYKSLPENSPILDKALQFLQNSTSTGTDILTGIDSGQKGWFVDLLKVGATVAAAVIGGPVAETATAAGAATA